MIDCATQACVQGVLGVVGPAVWAVVAVVGLTVLLQIRRLTNGTR